MLLRQITRMLRWGQILKLEIYQMAENYQARTFKERNMIWEHTAQRWPDWFKAE